MIVLVCGGRDFIDQTLLSGFLDANASKITAIVHGNASGADRMAGDWAAVRGLPEIRVPANWGFYKNAAGPIRNGWMLTFCKPDVVAAFPGGNGTANMVDQARKAGVRVIEVKKK